MLSLIGCGAALGKDPGVTVESEVSMNNQYALAAKKVSWAV